MYCTLKRKNLVILIVALSVVIISLAIALLLTVSHYQTNTDASNQMLKEITQGNADLQKQISDIESKYEDIESKYEEANKNKTSLESEVSKLKNEIRTLQTDKIKLSNQLSEAQKKANEWEKKFLESDSQNVEYSYSFNDVTSLYNAVKKNPEAYYGKPVKVLTVVYEDSEDPYLYMFDPSVSIDSSLYMNGVEWRYLVNQHKPLPALLDEYPLYAFIDSGDYVKMYGIVSINSDATICLSSCVFEVIQTSEERK